MISYPNAKINLGLLVTSKRSDGYHNIETVLHPVQLYDVLEINDSDQVDFRVDGLPIPLGGANLCEKAFQLLESDYHIAPVRIHLLKNIPIGAGLGGGSADAAFTLKMLNDYYKLGLTLEDLKTYAERLGADCAFFLENRPVFASGIGTTFEDVDIDLSSYFIVVIQPDIHISTAEAYQCVVARTPSMDLRRAIRLPVQEWKYHITNDFEIGIFEKYPIIEEIKHALYEKGAIYAAMSGSGSAVFGIFDQAIELNELNALGTVYYPIDL